MDQFNLFGYYYNPSGDTSIHLLHSMAVVVWWWRGVMMTAGTGVTIIRNKETEREERISDAVLVCTGTSW